MKIKTLLLIPFLLSSCATNNEGSNVIGNPFVASKNAGSSVVYDDVASTTEDPYKQVEPQSEEGLIYYDRSYIGVNVGPIPTVGTVVVPDQEHCPFTPQFRKDMSEMVDSSAHGKNPGRAFGYTAFDDFAKEFEDTFMTDYYLGYQSLEEKQLNKEIKHATTKEYLSKFFKHTNHKNADDESKSYYVFAEALGNFCHSARHPKNPRDYYTDEYLTDLKAALDKDNNESYFELFDKYGTEYITALTFAPSQMMFMGFSSKSANAIINCNVYDKEKINEVVDKLLDDEPILNLDDYWVMGDERSYSSNDFDNIGARLITYRTKTFYDYLPEGYSTFTCNIEEAYKEYKLNKFEEYKKSIGNIDYSEKSAAIRDSHRFVGHDEVPNSTSKHSVTIKKNKEYLDSFRISACETMYNPQGLNGKGYKKVYFRPNIKFNEAHNDIKVTLQMMFGGKKIKVFEDKDLLQGEGTLTSPWYQLNTKDLVGMNDEAVISLTSKNSGCEITKCDFEIVYVK